jgi:hypothetical protein
VAPINDGMIELDHDTEGEDDMAVVPPSLAEQNLARLAQAGVQAHEHFVQFGKILDLAYEADRKMVSLVESLGVREVASRSGQLGIPIASTSVSSQP